MFSRDIFKFCHRLEVSEEINCTVNLISEKYFHFDSNLPKNIRKTILSIFSLDA